MKSSHAERGVAYQRAIRSYLKGRDMNLPDAFNKRPSHEAYGLDEMVAKMFAKVAEDERERENKVIKAR